MSSTTKPIKSTRKRKAPIDDNGEPVVVGKGKKAVLGPHPAKKQKKAPTKTVTPRTAATTIAPSTSQTKILPARQVSTNQQVPTRSVSVEDMFDKDDHSHSDPPHNPRYIIESVNSEEEDNGPAPAMNVDNDEDTEEPEEDDDAELG